MESSGKASKPIFDGMCPLFFFVFLKKTAVGSLDPSDAVVCHQLAASYGGTNGGLLGNLGTAAPLLDPRSLVGAADFTPATKRGTTHSVEKPWLFQFQHFNPSIWINLCLYLPFPICQVDNWNPLTDTVPIHSWIHPWLPLFQSRLEPLYPPIRSKLSHALQRWHPSDASARCILLPWKDVFTPGAWEAFMVKNIIPKLGLFVFLSVTVFSPQRSRTMDFLQSWPSLSSCLFS